MVNKDVIFKELQICFLSSCYWTKLGLSLSTARRPPFDFVEDSGQLLKPPRSLADTVNCRLQEPFSPTTLPPFFPGVLAPALVFLALNCVYYDVFKLNLPVNKKPVFSKTV